MRRRFRTALPLLAISWCGLAAGADAPPVVAFVDVNVVPMDRERVLEHQTVLVRGDRIDVIGPLDGIAVPDGARRIDGKGSAWLAPGLADMHTHVETPEDLALYVSFGVTTVLHMGGGRFNAISIPTVRKLFAGVLSPQAFFALKIEHQPPLNDGWPITSPDDARAAVRAAQAMQFDFVKMYNLPTAAEFDAIVDESRRQGLAVVGHGVRAVGLPAGLCRGQVMAAHAEEFLYTTFGYKPQYERIAEVAAETKRCGGYVTANLSTYQAIARQWGHPEARREMFADPLFAAMAPASRTGWTVPERDYSHRQGDPMASTFEFLKSFVGELARQGVPLLAGTDTPLIPGEIPGQALHDELQTLVDAGLTNFQALSAATRTPGEFITKFVPGTRRFGVVAPGARADLVLVASNPMLSLGALREPLGVMVAGAWHPAEELHETLQRNRASSDAQIELALGSTNR